MTVEICNGQFHYFGKDVLFDNISFSVKTGEILSILGPNGSGKTTLLKCINGLNRLAQGDVRIAGKSISAMRRKEIGKKISYVPQTYVSSFPYSVLEMVVMGRASHVNYFSSPKAEDVMIAEESLKSLNILHLKDSHYCNLSGGEAQLVLIARALTVEPLVLLLDEPASHLDIKKQTEILTILETLAGQKSIAVISTTHFPDHALAISDKILLMSKTNGYLFGSAEEVMTERNLMQFFEMDIRIITSEFDGIRSSHAVPIRHQALLRTQQKTL